MSSKGEIEAAICEEISSFEHDYMGRDPTDIRVYLLDDLLLIRLRGVLAPAEQNLVKSCPAEQGWNLLKQERSHLIETARPVMEAIVKNVTGVKVVTMFHDIDMITGEKVILFTLAQSPDFSEANSLQRIGPA